MKREKESEDKGKTGKAGSNYGAPEFMRALGRKISLFLLRSYLRAYFRATMISTPSGECNSFGTVPILRGCDASFNFESVVALFSYHTG